MDNTISEVTRRSIIDHFVISGTRWPGRLTEVEFLARLYNLAEIPSTDSRLRNAAGDIRQHRVNWSDWPDDWVFFDSRFNILFAPDDVFLRFLIETVHPVVRPDAFEAQTLVDTYNLCLRSDGWELFERIEMSGHPVFGARKVGQRVRVFDEPTGWAKVDRQNQEVRLQLDRAQNEEQFQTIGLLCREILISLSETVYIPSIHLTTDAVTPSKTDAGRMLEAYFESELKGGVNEETRAYAKAALKLAVALQHKRTADFLMAALCAEATVSVVNIVAVLSGRRAQSEMPL